MGDLAYYLFLAFGLVCGWVGWWLHGWAAERDQYRAEEQRDREWDKAHGIGDGDG